MLVAEALRHAEKSGETAGKAQNCKGRYIQGSAEFYEARRRLIERGNRAYPDGATEYSRVLRETWMRAAFAACGLLKVEAQEKEDGEQVSFLNQVAFNDV